MSESKETVAGWFEISVEVLDGANILFAEYDNGGYEGSAFVLLERQGKLFEVHGSHCSCYGLEDQWGEEETSIEALEHRVKEGWGFYLKDERFIEVLNGIKAGK